MTYVRKESRTKQLEESFLSKTSDRWEEYTYLGGYVNKDTKIRIRHNTCGNEFMMTPHNFKSGHGCPICGRKAVSKKLVEKKQSAFNKFMKGNKEYTLLSEYKNKNTPVKILHKTCGLTFEYKPCMINQSLQNKSGTICPHCNKEYQRMCFTYTIEQANKCLEQANPDYELLTYNGAHNLAQIRHKCCGHIFEQKPYYFMVGNGHCPKCTTNISKEEREIFSWFKTLCPDAVQSNRTVLDGKELDMYSPSKKVAIEYNGHYWHSVKKLMEKGLTYAEAKRYHRDKSDACAAQGVRLIHIWDYVWADERKRAVLKNIILGATQSLSERYFARKCQVMRYTAKDARWGELNAFFAKNNIQGNRGGSVVYTLEYDGRILMAYKFGRPSGGNAKMKYQYEMVRGASAPGVQVVGGATKLWKHFIDTEKPKSVVYYIDYNYFDGKSVEAIGLKYVGGQPGVKNYFTETHEVKNRQPRKHAEVKKLIKQGKVLELWNCGVKTYNYFTE